MGLRIAIGSGKCADHEHSRDPVVRGLCQELLSRLAQLQALTPEQLSRLPSESHELVQVGSQDASFSTYRDPIEAGGEIVVVQGFLPSWRHARYFGAAGVGLMLAEGFLLQPGGPIIAPDDLLWGYR